MHLPRWPLLYPTLAWACDSGLPPPPNRPSPEASSEPDAGVGLSVEPGGQVDFAPSVLRIHLELPEGTQLSAGELQLYEGVLSAYHLGRVMRVNGERARYVRLFSNGSTESEMNHYVEVEVYGKPVK